MAKRAPKSSPIIDILNDVLTAELTAVNQYFLHAEIFHHWGLERLHKKVRVEAIDEMKHAEKLIERVLYLDGLPNVQRLGKVNIGESTKEIFDVDLALEREAVPRLAAGIVQCTNAGDHGSRLLLEEILESEEEHLDWLITQVELIEKLGEQAYEAEHLHE